MNDLMYKMMFGFIIAERQGLERNEAMKIGLLSAMDNSKNPMVPVLSSKLMADDKVEIKTLQASQTKLRTEIAILETESRDIISKIFDATTPPTLTELQTTINNSNLLLNFKP